MKNVLYFVCIALIVSLLSCAKSGKKALEKGDYYTATLQAIDKLNRDADNSKSANVLAQAYKFALTDLDRKVNADKQTAQPFKWERVVDDYRKLNTMYSKIVDCTACSKITNPKAFFDEEDEAIDFAAKERYGYALVQLDKQTLEAGRRSYESFEVLRGYAPDYKDSGQKMEEALNMGSVHVVIEQPRLNARLYDYSYEYFQNQVEDYLTSNRQFNKFVRFYQPSEAEDIQLKPDHLVRLEFIDFVVGQIRVDSKEKQVTSEDSVKTGTIKIEGENVDVYGRVNARVIENRKQVHSHGVMLMQVVDYSSNRVLLTRELPGEFDWFTEWLTYNGDERALTKEQIRQARNQEQLPPPPQQLFIEFCKPIYNQFTNEISRFYRKY
jgi:hypothetical protein